ncbi:winged helix-turn-helix transcriptional regulator [candidate division KSB1 bacterium]|nr:MAG: winged helix-turn-helix transcriptional regulator [candidate division KSB1 bacterium]MBC6949283.1 winged helix-turn-helix transcriptional regulator [candidate division KSB1 bacterium]MCE7945096.1 winged helix-turn-helix transcriptional regulator [Chlorobi bacterium CHB1]MDL1874238.1 winged helix-turn-helix transcriptional regulator [Cytophagia bacterium CHB2]
MKEDQSIEYKASWRDEYLKWICGFANAEGGTLVIGKNDRGEVVGVANAPKLLEDIPNKVRDILGIMVKVNLRAKAGREYLEIVVEPYSNPVSYKGEYFYRSGSTNQILKGAALDRFLLRKQGRHWDGVPVPHVTIKDLSKPAIVAFRQLARESQRLDSTILRESTPGLIDKLHLLDNQYLKRAAVLVFHPDPERFFTGAFVKIGFFRTSTDLLYHDEIHGDLLTQVSKTMDLLLTKYLRASISYRGIRRLETFPVPEAALREAVLNAIIHKDYGADTPIQISVYSDKNMVWNPGELPPDWTVAKLKGKHPSQPFNPDIANVFFRAGMIEAWGRGIARILEACKAARLPEPEINYEKTGLWFGFHFSEQQMGSTTQETTQEKILALLRTNPTITRKAMAVELGFSDDGIKYHLGKLKSAGIIRHVGSTKAGRWEILK